jgi:hypothetical protein
VISSGCPDCLVRGLLPVISDCDPSSNDSLCDLGKPAGLDVGSTFLLFVLCPVNLGVVLPIVTFSSWLSPSLLISCWFSNYVGAASLLPSGGALSVRLYLYVHSKGN